MDVGNFIARSVYKIADNSELLESSSRNYLDLNLAPILLPANAALKSISFLAVISIK